MPRDLRPTLAVSLVFVSMTGLLACPQLLSDHFDSALSTGDEGCAQRLTCAAGASGSSSSAGSGGSAGSAGSTSGASGSSPGSGGSGSSGAAGSGGDGSGGSAGSADSAGSGGSAGSAQPDASVDPPDTDASPDCWLVKLDDSTHLASDNCLGIQGWNQVETDPATATNVDTAYEDDGVCFTGTVVNEGWGAVYNITFNDSDPWDAAALGVGGFQLDAEGASLPPEMQVVYTDDDAGDFCRIITPGAAVQVPFASAHPDCSSSSSSVTDSADLTFLRLVMPIAASDYAVDFCLSIRAIP